eukprot:CAMPEP_0196586798 /NCGR_PEP_ID=MMETSP1081-20130531/55567_1 /TAXON_ID=36882 /ORGANISM="Pyramimonas amylifera, Strain CCMP720" /LENGTH=327 /DNA_ID=CAMNT_0041908791 /DNA_START=203 /DNA_END=1183 /DNA_ORIENTATION=+
MEKNFATNVSSNCFQSRVKSKMGTVQNVVFNAVGLSKRFPTSVFVGLAFHRAHRRAAIIDKLRTPNAAPSSADHSISPGQQKFAGARLGAFYFTFFGVVGVRTPLLPLWLQSVARLDPGQIGAALVAMQLCQLAASPLLAILADYIKNPRGLVIALTLAASLMSISLILLTQSRTHKVWMVVLSSTLCSASLPLSESMSQSVLGPGSPKYGRVRMWGSLGFMITSTFVAQAATRRGNWIILYFLAGFMALTAGAAMLQPTPSIPSTSIESKSAGNLFDVPKLLGNPVFALGMSTAALLQATHAMYYGFGSIAFSSAGHSGGTIGLLW